MGGEWQFSTSEEDDFAREEAAVDEQPYDLSFAYKIKWEHPDEDLKEAVKVLLCAPSGEGHAPAEAEAVAPEALSAEEAQRIRCLLVSNPNTPPPVLDYLVNEGSPALLERIAEHPRTRPATLARLAFDLNQDVRAAVAENFNCPAETLRMLAQDEHPDVRYRVAESYHVPFEVLQELAEDENPYVSYRARQTLARLLMPPAVETGFGSDWTLPRDRKLGS
jgi:hypothetical protein